MKKIFLLLLAVPVLGLAQLKTVSKKVKTKVTAVKTKVATTTTNQTSSTITNTIDIAAVS